MVLATQTHLKDKLITVLGDPKKLMFDIKTTKQISLNRNVPVFFNPASSMPIANCTKGQIFVWRIPATCTFFFNPPALRTNLKKKQGLLIFCERQLLHATRLRCVCFGRSCICFHN
jgi:hypothetical protein